MAKRADNGSIDVTQGVIRRQLLALCVPIFFSSFFQQAYALINTYIVGQFGGKIALGGIQSTLSLSELAIGFCIGLGAGCAVITGQFFGQRDDARLSRSIHTAMTLAIVLGACISVLGVIFLPAILTAMGTPRKLMWEARSPIRAATSGRWYSLSCSTWAPPCCVPSVTRAPGPHHRLGLRLQRGLRPHLRGRAQDGGVGLRHRNRPHHRH